MRIFAGLIIAFLIPAVPLRAQDPLPSWNDGPAKKAIVDFVGKVTKEGGPDFVPVADRIAVFDNDGTLWCEQPLYVQLAFAFDRVKEMVEKQPDLKDKEPYQAIVAGDLKALAAAGEKAVADVLLRSHAGISSDEFEAIVLKWLKTARHPRFKKPYTELVYQPMLELLAYLRAHQFKTYIVSGGGGDFMRPWTPAVYGIQPEQVVGSSNKLKYEYRDGKPVLLRLPEIDFIDDKAGKPVGIHRFIGRRPIMAFGNSDGDLEMLQWTTAGKGPRFGLIVHHTDAEREYAYDRESPIGRLDKALDQAPKQGWVVASMKRDWKVVFPSEK